MFCIIMARKASETPAHFMPITYVRARRSGSVLILVVFLVLPADGAGRLRVVVGHQRHAAGGSWRVLGLILYGTGQIAKGALWAICSWLCS